VAVSTIGVADASVPDKYLHTHSRTISSTAREDQYVQQGESAYPTYIATPSEIALTTDAAHVLQIMGDGSNYSRLKSIEFQGYNSSAASTVRLLLYRLSSAGTGGSSITPSPFDTSDTYGGGAMTLPSSKGTEGALLGSFLVPLPVVGGNTVGASVGWHQLPGMKPIIFGTATSNGIAVKIATGVANGALLVRAVFVTTTYL